MNIAAEITIGVILLVVTMLEVDDTYITVVASTSTMEECKVIESIIIKDFAAIATAEAKFPTIDLDPRKKLVHIDCQKLQVVPANSVRG